MVCAWSTAFPRRVEKGRRKGRRGRGDERKNSFDYSSSLPPPPLCSLPLEPPFRILLRPGDVPSPHTLLPGRTPNLEGGRGGGGTVRRWAAGLGQVPFAHPTSPPPLLLCGLALLKRAGTRERRRDPYGEGISEIRGGGVKMAPLTRRVNAVVREAKRNDSWDELRSWGSQRLRFSWGNPGCKVKGILRWPCIAPCT